MARAEAPRQRPSDPVALAMGVGSWVFAALAFLTLGLGLFGVDWVPHFPLMAFVWLGLAALLRILKDQRQPQAEKEGYSP